MWTDATRRVAAVPAEVHGRSKVGFRWTHDLVAYGLDLFHRRHLRTPTVKELREGIDDLPSYATIRRLYGSAGRMLRRHGYRVRSAGGQPGRPMCDLERDAKGRLIQRRLSACATIAEPDTAGGRS
jgi:hypothetical protein